jgi:hypothetical protein
MNSALAIWRLGDWVTVWRLSISDWAIDWLNCEIGNHQTVDDRAIAQSSFGDYLAC